MKSKIYRRCTANEYLKLNDRITAKIIRVTLTIFFMKYLEWLQLEM